MHGESINGGKFGYCFGVGPFGNTRSFWPTVSNLDNEICTTFKAVITAGTEPSIIYSGTSACEVGPSI